MVLRVCLRLIQVMLIHPFKVRCCPICKLHIEVLRSVIWMKHFPSLRFIPYTQYEDAFNNEWADFWHYWVRLRVPVNRGDLRFPTGITLCPVKSCHAVIANIFAVAPLEGFHVLCSAHQVPIFAQELGTSDTIHTTASLASQ